MAGLGVTDLDPSLGTPSFPESESPPLAFLDAVGAGVDEAEDRPLLGLTGSFLWSPFSFGGVRRRPFWIREEARSWKSN